MPNAEFGILNNDRPDWKTIVNDLNKLTCCWLLVDPQNPPLPPFDKGGVGGFTGIA